MIFADFVRGLSRNRKMPRRSRRVIRVDHPDELQEYVINRFASSFVARDRVNSSWHTSTISQERTDPFSRTIPAAHHSFATN